MSSAAVVGCGTEPVDEPQSGRSSALQRPETHVGSIEVSANSTPGFLVDRIEKIWPNDWVRDQCGGDYSIEIAVEVGDVGDDSIEIKNITYFYNGNAYNLNPRGFADAYSNGTPNIHLESGILQQEESGRIYQHFEVNQTFSGLRGSDDHGLVFEHWLTPAAPYKQGLGGDTVCGMLGKVLVRIV